MRYQFHTLDVFTDRVLGGNPLAVFPAAGGLTTAQMQRVAREFNLSETVFVLPPDDPGHARRLRIFTPQVELPFAGHPTIGTAHLLASLGELPLADGETHVVFEENVGPVPVSIHARGGAPTFAQMSAARLPEFGPEPPPRAVIARALSLDEADIGAGEWQPAGVSCGVPFLFVPLRSRDALRRARVDRAHWETHLAGWWSPHLFAFCRQPELPISDLRARMFAPAAGIEEDPATGGAAVALAGYLAARDATANGRLRWVVEQGFEMGRPSILHLEADKKDGRITDVRVGGTAVRVSEGLMTVPAA